MTRYDPAMTMREARERYFADNDFGPNGGYEEAWVDFKIGPIPFPFPNTAARVRAVKVHDLHHILTGYQTDFRGELEISAWEIGAGCKDYYAAWQLNLGGMGFGAMMMPRRTFRAFVRGRRSQSLYGLDLDELLDASVADARRQMGVPDAPTATPADSALFGLGTLAGLVTGGVSFVAALALMPIGVPALVLAKARSTGTAA